MATRFYANNLAAAATPSAVQGTWDNSASMVTKDMDVAKVISTFASVAVAETSATATNVALLRLVSPPLSAQTISGTLQLTFMVLESANAADMVYRVHAYVMDGSGNVRGTLLSNYTDNLAAKEWPQGFGFASSQNLNGAQTLTNVTCSDGDRIVVEIGYQAQNTSTTSFTGTIWYGGDNGNIDANTAITALNQSSVTQTYGWVEFSAAIALQATGDLQLSQEVVEAATFATAPAIQVSQVIVEALLTPSVSGGRSRSMIVIAG